MLQWPFSYLQKQGILLCNFWELYFAIPGNSSLQQTRNELECTHNYPRDVYFIGNLRPYRNEIDNQFEQNEHSQELPNKLALVAFGAEFLVHPKNKTVIVDVTLSWACYYRVFPTLEQQRNYQRHTNVENNDLSELVGQRQLIRRNGEYIDSIYAQEDDLTFAEIERENQIAEAYTPEIAHSALDRHRARTPKDSLFIRFRKIPCQCSGKVFLTCNQDGTWSVDVSQLQTSLDQEMDSVQQIIASDPERIRTSGNLKRVKIPETALETEETYYSFLQSLQIDTQPEWKWDVRGETWAPGRVDPSERVLAIEFVNISPMEESPNTEPFLFETEAAFVFTGCEVCPFELDLAPRGFRYNRQVWGRGINCAVERLSENTYITTHTPIYPQMRYLTKTVPSAKFSDLAENPIPILDSILHAMEEYREVWKQERQNYTNSDPKWEDQHASEFDQDFQKFEEEIEDFQRGYELINSNPDIRFAFQLTNETFRRTQKTEWRLFQIVFLVSQIPAIAALQDPNSPDVKDRERVDIIYFPTGGGKTEAYLGTIVFHCFFDRLRGKAAGVTAWTRFPLRLLTLQQTQRVADIIGLAELVRREQSDPRLNGNDVDGFAVGYFVGQGGSPNETIDPRKYPRANAETHVVWSQVNDPDLRQYWKRIVRCPSCRTSTIRVEFDARSIRLIHRCTQPTCRFPNGVIPVYIVDNEIYRYLPSVIVGTIDKLAGLGNQRKFALLFGQVDGRCTLHGYYKGRCCQKDCNNPTLLRQVVPKGLSGPTLFVQDELHLLKEGLGTFDGHYETFVQRLQMEFGQTHHLKIIASSATIEAFERQVNHLYGRSSSLARVFPGLGPILGQSFYAETLSIPQRLYVGLIPHNKTIFNTILELIESYHREILSLQHLSFDDKNPYGGVLKPGTPEWRELLDLYATSLTYFLASRELDSIRTDLEGDVIPNLQRDGLPPLSIFELTGSTSTDEVSTILERLETPSLSTNSADVVLATSMVSHGVDVDRLNTMFFYGIPRQNAEYIQASSRVGRSHVGIVFICFHPVRERDHSHYAYFNKYHEFLGQLVEPVAINRWSIYSINRTLPGLFMGILLQLIANISGESNPNRYYMLNFVRGKINDGIIQPEHFVPLLEQAYAVQNPTMRCEEIFREKIKNCVGKYFRWILSPSSGATFVSDVLYPKPMRSLRDVDEAIPIELDSLGTQWTNQIGRS